MTTLTTWTAATYIKEQAGPIQVKIPGQAALPKWQQQIMREALNDGRTNIAGLRYACRIAQDVNLTFEDLELADGTHLTLNPASPAQFGRNKDGDPYLTVGVIWSGNAISYRLKWVGESVPLKMQQVAVKHDEGRKVGAAVVTLDLMQAKVQPAGHHLDKDGNDHKSPSRVTRKKGGPRRKFTAGRLCAADLERLHG